MILSSNELENEYKEHFWVIRKFGFDTRDENVEELVKYLIDYYGTRLKDIDEAYDEGYNDGWSTSEKQHK